MGEQFHEGGVPEGYYEIPFGKPDIKREGKDVTILTVGATLYRALKAADDSREKYGMEAEVIDARTLVPFDYEPVHRVRQEDRPAGLVTDACERGSLLNEVARHGDRAGVRRPGRAAGRRGLRATGSRRRTSWRRRSSRSRRGSSTP